MVRKESRWNSSLTFSIFLNIKHALPMKNLAKVYD